MQIPNTQLSQGDLQDNPKMDKYKATTTLTERLAGHFGKLIISDSSSKEKILADSKYSYPVGNYIDMYLERDLPRVCYRIGLIDGRDIRSQKIEGVIDKIVSPEANYVFLSDKVSLGDYKCLVSLTPYAIIGPKETEAVKNKFYKDYDINVREAIRTLGIQDFFEMYRHYFDNGSKLKKLLFSFREELLNFLDSREYDVDDETRIDAFERTFGIENLNSNFRKLGVNFFIDPRGRNFIKKSAVVTLSKMLKECECQLFPREQYKIDFLKFVFELPYEDQNIEMNKVLFKSFKKDLNTDFILLEEFKQGKYFKEYFELLDKDGQEEIVSLIKESNLKNPEYNAFLWSKGYKNVDLDYLSLYNKCSQGFVEYFQSRSTEEKKMILNDLMDCEFTNNEVVNWLNENEQDLIREVGFNG